MMPRTPVWFALAALVNGEPPSPVLAAPVRKLAIAADPALRRALSSIVPAFSSAWRRTRGESVRVFESYGRSDGQARAVIAGLRADVVLLTCPADVDRLAAAGLVLEDWRDRFPEGGIVGPGHPFPAEVSVAVVDAQVDRRRARETAVEFIRFLHGAEIRP